MTQIDDRFDTPAMNAAVRLLSRRNHTTREIRQKLRQRGFDADTISRVLSECERLNYLNDEQTARFYIRELVAKGYGPRRIRMSLKKKGISDELADRLLPEQEAETDELENARQLLSKKQAKFDREKDLRKRKEKIYRFLSYRGFSASVISELIFTKDVRKG